MEKNIIGYIIYDEDQKRIYWQVGKHDATAKVDITEPVKAFCSAVEEPKPTEKSDVPAGSDSLPFGSSDMVMKPLYTKPTDTTRETEIRSPAPSSDNDRLKEEFERIFTASDMCCGGDLCETQPHRDYLKDVWNWILSHAKEIVKYL